MGKKTYLIKKRNKKLNQILSVSLASVSKQSSNLRGHIIHCFSYSHDMSAIGWLWLPPGCSFCSMSSHTSVQLLSHVWLFATPWTEAFQASLSITNSWSLLKLTSTESVMPSNHLILCHPLLLLPSIFPSIRVFSNESVLHISWPKYWSFGFSISPSNEYSGLISFRMD